MEKMTQLLLSEQTAAATNPPPASNTCWGTLLSRQQYLKDVAEWKYDDARTKSLNNRPPYMNEEAVAHWTAAAFCNHGPGNP